MTMTTKLMRLAGLSLLATTMLASPAATFAQDAPLAVNVNATTPVPGPEIKGVISARSGDKMQVTGQDGTKTVVILDDSTKIASPTGLIGLRTTKQTVTSLINGLPVSVKTMQIGGGLTATEVKFKSSDLKTAQMIRSGTEQGFADQSAATAELRGRMGDIDQYDIKGTTNVTFATGKSTLSPQAKTDLCAAAKEAEGIKNSLLLVLGYTDSTGNAAANQKLSDDRAETVVNYLQQTCKWKPYRMLTPAGMSMAEPVASNDTAAGKAANRRVSVNILVSKAVEGL
jgi:outer membrane protein OmpA-like peptidoglycan-associated protein